MGNERGINPMDIKEILKSRGFDITSKTKLVRHQESDVDIMKIYNSGMINIYQSIQSKDVFNKCDYIISFLGIERIKAKFVGIYKVIGVKNVRE
jgi:hypothetical protein